MIKSLTSLRFAFAFIVFISHSTFLVKQSPSLKWFYESVIIDSMAGVTFFFVLSGFILAKSYGDKIISGVVSKREFILKRFARIYPLHLATLFLYLPYFFYSIAFKNEAIEKWRFIKKLLINLFLLQSFFPQIEVYFSFNEPSWSISNEIFFYLMFPIIVPFFLNRKKMGLWILIAVATVLLLGMILLNINFDHYLFYINPFVRLVDFVLGISIYSLLQTSKIELKASHATMLETGAIVTLISSLLLHNYLPEVYRYSVYYWPPIILLIGVFYYQRGLISELLSKRGFVFLGNISFGFYMLHWEIIRYISGINEILDLTDNAFLLGLLMFAITLLSSSLSYLYFERPIVQLMARFLQRSQAKPKYV